LFVEKYLSCIFVLISKLLRVVAICLVVTCAQFLVSYALETN
jgi:hypothetical protein